VVTEAVIVIPTVDNIVDGLIAGTMNRDEAISWIHAHIDGAQDRDELAALAMNGLMANAHWDADIDASRRNRAARLQGRRLDDQGEAMSSRVLGLAALALAAGERSRTWTPVHADPRAPAVGHPCRR
jgi:phosphoserine phosphatase